MRQQLALSAIVSFLLLLQLTTVCNGRATKTSKKEDALESLAKRLKSLIADKEHEVMMRSSLWLMARLTITVTVMVSN